MRFSEQLREAAAGLWRAQQDHPFVRGIADGTLAPPRFRFYMRQDYLFLIEYARLLALACARAPRLELMERFAELTRSTLITEMELHRRYAAEWGITREELEAERPRATTRAYTDFLLRTAALGEFAELVAALLPCMWGYSELGQRLARGSRPPEERYARWIDMYSGEELREPRRLVPRGLRRARRRRRRHDSRQDARGLHRQQPPRTRLLGAGLAQGAVTRKPRPAQTGPRPSPRSVEARSTRMPTSMDAAARSETAPLSRSRAATQCPPR
jgi:thiaminase/transcriptional activator TenA